MVDPFSERGRFPGDVGKNTPNLDRIFALCCLNSDTILVMKILYSYIRRFWYASKGAAAYEERESRAENRLAHCVSLVSEQLPNSRALSVDTSRDGLCIETFESLPKGLRLDMEMDIGTFPITLRGTVRWCKKISEGIFRVGICLSETSHHNRHALALYLGQLQR